jgi:hypothetical protein
MKLIATLLLLTAMGLAHADPMYISDKLVVSVYAEANQESERVATLDSGDRVESIEVAEGYTRVRLSDEREGWIRSTYLMPQPPAVVRLRALEQERATSTQSVDELKKLKDQNSALQREVSELKQAAAKAAASPPVAAPAIEATPPTPLGRWEGEAVPLVEPPTAWLRYVGGGAAILIVGAALGYLLGFQTLARRIRRKYGSVKIY